MCHEFLLVSTIKLEKDIKFVSQKVAENMSKSVVYLRFLQTVVLI